MDAPRIGPYLLDRRIGRGGMGEVWSALHVHANLPVAIKIITDERAAEPRYQRAFRREIRAVAGLDHPSIVRVHDVGHVPAQLAAQQPGFMAHAPFLVMDLLPEGSLRDHARQLRWPALRQLLLDMLSALAHAHARGVVHRDIKPDNLLWQDGHRRVVLTDFGVAHATDRDAADLTNPSQLGETVGTPAYMAPEQIKGLWRDQGPWTDLYALGCTAWELVTGQPPFRAPQPLATMVAQLTQPIPALQPAHPMPTALTALLRRMLAKNPRTRFRRAADVAYAVRQLAAPPRAPATTSAQAFDMATAQTLASTETLPDCALDLDATPIGGGPMPAGPPDDRAPLATDWRTLDTTVALKTSPGTGLGLFELRPIPFVGRHSERDALWRALHTMLERQRPTAALVLGPSGYGKTRLATWLSELAHAAGAATPLHVFYGAERGPAHGHAAMLRRYLHAQRLGRAAIYERIQAAIGHLGYDQPLHAEALTELIEPASDAERARRRIPRLETTHEAFAVVRRFVRAVASERPVILQIEDAQWGSHGVEFARQLLDLHADLTLPVLIVLTARTDLLAERPIEEANLRRLSAHAHTQQIRVGPLAESARHTLVQSMLGLTPALARRIDKRTSGNPLFAVQLVRAWIHHDLLLPTPSGIDLRPATDAEAALPADLHALWTQRIEALLAQRPAWQAEALEMAAVLGLEVHAGEWERALEQAELEVPDDLVEALLDQGLARTDRDGPEAGWAFVHAMLREAILAQARAHGRITWHHAACAQALQALPHPAPDRVARHLLGAGRPAEAIAPLTAAIESALDQGSIGPAQAQLDTRTDLLTSLSLPAEDPRWGHGWVLAARLAQLSGDFKRAAAFTQRTGQAADRYGWTPVQAQLEYVLGASMRDRGQAAEAQAHVERGLTLAEQVGDARTAARCRAVLAQIFLRLGRMDAAVPLFERTRAAFLELDDPGSAALCDIALARISKQAGAVQAAEAHNATAHGLFEQAGHRDGLARCANQRGDLLRLRGALHEAADAYREALEGWQVIDAPAAVYAQANLALTLVEAGRADEALRSLNDARATFERLRQWPMVAAVTAAALPCHAAAGDWAAFERDLASAKTLIAHTGLIDVDSAQMLELAGQQARGARPDLALAVLRLARQQWAALKRISRVASLDTVLAQLDDAGRP
jgi:serine/threonine protein kinase/tetratricopeptide (TPR) repeat protein